MCTAVVPLNCLLHDGSAENQQVDPAPWSSLKPGWAVARRLWWSAAHRVKQEFRMVANVLTRTMPTATGALFARVHHRPALVLRSDGAHAGGRLLPCVEAMNNADAALLKAMLPWVEHPRTVDVN